MVVPGLLVCNTELPPVNEAFYLNCDLLFALADELNVSYIKKSDIDNTIHEDGVPIFLTEALDNRFWARKNIPAIDPNDLHVEFTGKKLVIPASCLTDRFIVTVSVSGGTVLDDWKVDKVDRPKNSTDCFEFIEPADAFCGSCFWARKYKDKCAYRFYAAEGELN